MYIIFNLVGGRLIPWQQFMAFRRRFFALLTNFNFTLQAMSSAFSEVQIDKLPFPSQMVVDWVR